LRWVNIRLQYSSWDYITWGCWMITR
jgi:hypothetical protein